MKLFEKKRKIKIFQRRPFSDCCAISSIESTMSKKEFLKHCEEFFDNYGTSVNDYNQMFIEITKDN
jgi:uridine kinase